MLVLQKELSVLRFEKTQLVDAADRQQKYYQKVLQNIDEVERSRKELIETRILLSSQNEKNELEATREMCKPKWVSTLKSKALQKK